MFDNEFISSLPKDATKAVLMVCEKFLSTTSENGSVHHDIYRDALGFFEALIDAYKIKEDFNFPELSCEKEKNVKAIADLFSKTYKVYDQRYQQEALEASKSKYALQLGDAFLYKLAPDELSRIQRRLTELITLVSKNDKLEMQYKIRILKRLTDLQISLTQKLPELGRLWRLVSEAGVVAGMVEKRGNAIITTLQELLKIIWRVQLRAEGLNRNVSHPLFMKEKK